MSTFWQLSITGLPSTVFCTIGESLDEVAPDIYLHLAIHSKIALNYWFSLGDYKVKHCALSSAPSAEPLRLQVINRRKKKKRNHTDFYQPFSRQYAKGADLYHVLSHTALPGGHLHKTKQVPLQHAEACYAIPLAQESSRL